ncbi:hypothetical protein OG342_37945 [Streptomyces bobili]|uniref:hypothetical protein n=1 Tax=Streptomyces bobili TaxID=67280 RepID=UPI00225BEA5E|nr:hypothetical protein [Streptomyces bobili]MCX5528571.1 hypothetical protein [Streptomyces bobili]
MPRGTKVTVLQAGPAGWSRLGETAVEESRTGTGTGTGTGKSCCPQGPASHREVAIRFRGRA